MSWFDHQDSVQTNNKAIENKPNSNKKTIEVMMPGGKKFIKLNKNNIHRVYDDELSAGPLFIIIDEVAELLMKSKGSSAKDKEEDAMRSECESIIQSITQLGRSAGIHMVLCTQRASTNVINGNTLNNLQMRLACGRLNGMASLMALGNTYGTTIPGDIPGRGCISSNGVINNIQYYFAENTWIDEWFMDRGLDKLGYLKGERENLIESDNDDETYMNFDEIESLSSNKENIKIEFAGVEGNVSKNHEQDFEEV